MSLTLHNTHTVTRTKATSCVEVWYTSNLRPLRLGEKKEERKKKVTTVAKYNRLPIAMGGHNNLRSARRIIRDRISILSIDYRLSMLRWSH